MDQYILENVDRFHLLISRWKPGRRKDPEPADANSKMLVAARLRPLLEDEATGGFPPSVFLRPGKPGVIDVHELRHPPRGPAQLKSTDYCADRAYDTDITTEHIYKDVVKPLLPWAWNGGTSTLFAYGQTGSGKTFTISALEKLVAEELMSGQLEGERKLYMTIIELAGNTANDLLNNRGPVSLLDDAAGVTRLHGAVEQEVSAIQDMLALITTAADFRRTETTEKNDASSRSHAICRIRIKDPSIAKDTDDEDGVFYLVDLAGSEAARDTANHSPQRMREAREINSSLAVLKACIRLKAEADLAAAAPGASSSKRAPYIPFRQSPLTRVLKHIFDPAAKKPSKTIVIGCVNPCILDAGPSRNTLKYAETLRVMAPS